MKLFCLQPYGYGYESFYVMASNEVDALHAIFAFQAAPENGNYRFADTRQEFDRYIRSLYEPIKAFELGQVAVNANS